MCLGGQSLECQPTVGPQMLAVEGGGQGQRKALNRQRSTRPATSLQPKVQLGLRATRGGADEQLNRSVQLLEFQPALGPMHITITVLDLELGHKTALTVHQTSPMPRPRQFPMKPAAQHHLPGHPGQARRQILRQCCAYRLQSMGIGGETHIQSRSAQVQAPLGLHGKDIFHVQSQPMNFKFPRLETQRHLPLQIHPPWRKQIRFTLRQLEPSLPRGKIKREGPEPRGQGTQRQAQCNFQSLGMHSCRKHIRNTCFEFDLQIQWPIKGQGRTQSASTPTHADLAITKRGLRSPQGIQTEARLALEFCECPPGCQGPVLASAVQLALHARPSPFAQNPP